MSQSSPPLHPLTRSLTPQERKEAEKWSQGSKAGKAKDDKEEKRKAELARKAENARLLAEEEASAPSKAKAAPKAGAKKAGPAKKDIKPAGPGAIAAGGGLGAISAAPSEEAPKEVESYSATGIDNAIDLLEVVNAKMDKASIGSRAADIERHPEVSTATAQDGVSVAYGSLQRRVKAAFEAYKERELPKARAEVCCSPFSHVD